MRTDGSEDVALHIKKESDISFFFLFSYSFQSLSLRIFKRISSVREKTLSCFLLYDINPFELKFY